MTSIKNSFKNKLILLIAFFQLSLIFLLGFFFTNDIIRREQKRISIENTNLAENITTEINNKINLFTKDMELFASLPAIENYNKTEASEILKNETVSSRFLANEKLLVYDNNHKLFADNTIFGSPEDSIVKDSLLLSTITPLKPYISGVTIGEYIYPSITMGVYIQNKAIGYGILTSKFSLQRFSDIFSSKSERILILFDKNGDFILSSNDSIKTSNIKDYNIPKTVFSQSALASISINNNKYFYASNFSKKTGLGVLVLEHNSNIEQTINRLKFIIFFALIATFFVSFLFSFILSSKLITPLKNLTEKIVAIKNGNLDISTKIDKSDEIAELANSFDNMRLNLKDSFSKLNLFISDLKMINTSSHSLMMVKSIEIMIHADLKRIKKVFNADIVNIAIKNTINCDVENFTNYEQDIDISAYNLNEIHTKTALINNPSESIIVAPITINDNVIGSIYINKLLTNFFDDNRLETAEILATQIAVGIESLRLYNEEKDKLLIEHDLQNAKVIQNAIYPSRPLDNENISLNFIYESADELTGDWFQYYTNKKDNLLYAIGDVTGHGVGASLLTSTVHTFFTIYTQDLISSIIGNLPKAMGTLNDIVNSAPEHLNMTLLLANLNFKTMEIEICNAGHNNAILFRKIDDDIKIITLINRNTRIGEMGQDYTSSSYKIQENDKILFYTDGIIEWEDEKGREWGKKGLVREIIKHFDKDDDMIIKNIVSVLDKKMINRKKMDDDLTLSILTVK